MAKKKIIILVNNDCVNDKRVKNIENSFKKQFETLIIAVNTYSGLADFESGRNNIQRVNNFSGLYAKKREFKISKKNKVNKFITILKNSKLRLFLTGWLNSVFLFFNYMCSLIINNPDIVYCNDLDTTFVGIVYAKIFNRKFIYDAHELWLFGNHYQSADFLKKRFWRMFEKTAVECSDLLITTTNERMKYFKDRYNVKKGFILYNYPGWQKIEESDKLKKEFKISSDKTVFLYQGLISEKRGVFSLVDVIKDFPQTVLIFMGEGDDTSLLYNYIKKNKLNDRIFIKNSVPYDILLNYTASADVGFQLLKNINLNHYTTISNKLFEYISAGIAVIASDFPEISRIVKQNDVGLIANPDNFFSIKSAVQKMLEDDNIVKYKRNSKIIRNNFVWEIQEKKFVETVRTI